MSVLSIMGIILMIMTIVTIKTLIASNLKIKGLDKDGNEIVVKPADWCTVIINIIVGLVFLFFIATSVVVLWNVSIFGITIYL